MGLQGSIPCLKIRLYLQALSRVSQIAIGAIGSLLICLNFLLINGTDAPDWFHFLFLGMIIRTTKEKGGDRGLAE
jgi:hypothetical protein